VYLHANISRDTSIVWIKWSGAGQGRYRPKIDVLTTGYIPLMVLQGTILISNSALLDVFLVHMVMCPATASRILWPCLICDKTILAQSEKCATAARRHPFGHLSQDIQAQLALSVYRNL